MHAEFLAAVSVMTLLTLLAYRLGARCILHRPSADTRVFLGVISGAFLFAWGYFGRLMWAERMPVSTAIYWSNLTPILLGFAAGLAGHAVCMRSWFRPIMSATLMLLAIGYLYTPIARPVLFPLQVDSRSQWEDRICLQTHESSCAPAAAVTLLMHHGIQSSESDLAAMCLTSAMGTEPLALYHGLADMAAMHGHQARVADSNPAHWRRLGQLPNVALVELDALPGDTTFRGFFGRAGVGHAIAILGRTDNGQWLIGDPAVGRVFWTDEQLRERFTGDAIFLRPAVR